MKKRGYFLFGIVLLLMILPLLSGANWTSEKNTNLLYYYKLEEASGNAFDSLGNFDLKVVGTPAYQSTGIIDYGYDLTDDGWLNNTIGFTEYDFPDNLTVSVWVNLTSAENYDYLFGFKNSSGGYIELERYGGWRLQVGSTTVNTAQGTGFWQNIVITKSGTNYSLYSAGTIAGSFIEQDISGNLTNFAFGSNPTASSRRINGTIDEIAIWNRTLSLSEIGDIWNGGVGISYDDSPPSISILSPSNNSNSSDSGLDINYSISDTYLDSCWYSNDTMEVNVSLGNGGSCSNITSVTWANGKHNVTIWANDSVGSENQTSITFTIDLSPPSIIVDEPQNNTNYVDNNSIELNFSVSDSLTEISGCWYMVVNSSDDLVIDNTTITNCQNTTFNISGDDEDYYLNLYVNDSVDNINNTRVDFGVRWDSPSINLNSPPDSQYFDNESGIYFNFTATDSDGLDTCELWGNWTGTWHKNYTWIDPPNATMNFTTLDLPSNESYLWSIWCNDTLGKSGFASANRTFTIDTIFPTINITSPTNGSTLSSTTVSINYTLTEINLDTCKWSKNHGVSNTTLTCRTNISDTFAEGSHNVTIYSKDKAGNENSSIVYFSVDLPDTPGGGGGGVPTNKAKVIAIIKPNQSELLVSNLQRAILFSRVNDFCIDKKYLKCSLTNTEKGNLLVILENQTIKNMDLDELKLWVGHYNRNKFDNVQVSLKDETLYDLDSGVIVREAEFKITPQSVTGFCLITSANKSCDFIINSGEVLSNVTLINGDVGLSVSKDTTTATITYTPPLFPPPFSMRVIEGSVAYVSENNKSAFQVVGIRAVYLWSIKTLCILGLIIGGVIFGVFKREFLLKSYKKTLKWIRRKLG